MRVNIKTAAFVIACILAMLFSLAYLAYGGDFVPDDHTACIGSAGQSATMSWDPNVPASKYREVNLF